MPLKILLTVNTHRIKITMVPTPGLEPGRPYGQGILSPLRLPIPPSGRFYNKY